MRSLVSKDRSYKPMVKSSGAQRESDGVVVLPIAGRNPAGGKGPDFGHAGNGGKREGMAGTARSNYPEGSHLAPDKVRRLQNRLWAAAKQSAGRRFHALYDRIYRSDILWEAWERVRANRGAAGVDAADHRCGGGRYGVERMLDELQSRPPCRHLPPGASAPGGDSKARRARSDRWASRRSRTGCASRRRRSSSNPSSRPTSCPARFGFRPKRSATDAMEAHPGRRSSKATSSSSRPTSRTSSARSTTRGLLVTGRRAGLGPTGAQAPAAVAACRGVGRRGRDRDGHGHAPGRGDLTAPGQHLPARLRPGLGRAWRRRSRPLCGRLRGAVLVSGTSRRSPAAGDRHPR